MAPRAASFSGDLGANRWQLTLGATELAPGSTHTVYARQRINGRDWSPVVSAQFTVSATVERLVSSLVSLETSNARMAGGVASYDLKLRNASGETIFTPLRAQVAQITSASGKVTVANADNGATAAGALWDFGLKVGADNTLTAGELSGARTLRFNNPNGETFTVTFSVIGHLARGSASAGAAGSGGASGPGTESGASGSGSTPTSAPAGSLAGQLFRVTFNPLLNTAVVEVVGK